MKYRLKEICIEVTSECPNDCLHCSSEASMRQPHELDFKEIKSIVDVFKEMSMPSLDRAKSLTLEDAIILISKINGLFDNGKKFKVEDKDALQSELLKLKEINKVKPVVELSGGEPFVREDIFDIISYIKEKNLTLIIYTSGIKKSKKGVVGIADDPGFIDKLSTILRKEDEDCIVLSLEGAKEKTHDLIMKREGHFKIVEDAIVAFKQKKMNIEIHCTPMKLNYMEIPSLIEKVNMLNISNISFLRLVPQGRARQNKDMLMLSPEEFKSLIDILHKEWLKAENNPSATKIRLGCPIDFRHLMYSILRKPCHGGRDQILIRPDGDIHPCPAWKEMKELSIGNIRNDKKREPIRDAWLNSDIINLFRSYSADNLWGDCYYCLHGTDICAGGCPAQRIISNKDRGIRNKEAQLRIGPDPLCFKHLL